MSPEDIRALYASLPAVHCKGLCTQHCGPIAFSGCEAAMLQEEGIALPTVVEHPKHGPLTCSHLTDAGRCAIYENRPLVCRLYGAVRPMACEHGCTPDAWVTEHNVMTILMGLQHADECRGLKAYFT